MALSSAGLLRIRATPVAPQLSSSSAAFVQTAATRQLQPDKRDRRTKCIAVVCRLPQRWQFAPSHENAVAGEVRDRDRACPWRSREIEIAQVGSFSVNGEKMIDEKI